MPEASKSLILESRFILSPILSLKENQEKINAIRDKSLDQDETAFEIQEFNRADGLQIQVQDVDQSQNYDNKNIENNNDLLGSIPSHLRTSFPCTNRATFTSNQVKRDNPQNKELQNSEINPAVISTSSQNLIHKTKTTDQMRRDFLSKLTYNKVWLTPNKKPKDYETVIIFDWDDTILCTSFINPTGTFDPKQKTSQYVLDQIADLEKAAKKILEMSIRNGITYIITNAGEGWVQFSAERFMPSLLPLLSKINIISARAKYEHLTQDYTKWKLHAFMEAQVDL